MYLFGVIISFHSYASTQPMKWRELTLQNDKGFLRTEEVAPGGGSLRECH